MLSRLLDTAAIFFTRLKLLGAMLLVGASAIVRKKKVMQVQILAPNGIPRPLVAWQRALLAAT